MRKSVRFPVFSILLAIIIALFSGCKIAPVIGGPVDHEKLRDGVYEGNYSGGPNKAFVKVTIKDKNIVEVQIVRHDAWKGKKAEPIIIERIVAEQSTRVDAVTGATNSSNVIMNAVQKAIEGQNNK